MKCSIVPTDVVSMEMLFIKSARHASQQSSKRYRKHNSNLREVFYITSFAFPCSSFFCCLLIPFLPFPFYRLLRTSSYYSCSCSSPSCQHISAPQSFLPIVAPHSITLLTLFRISPYLTFSFLVRLLLASLLI